MNSAVIDLATSWRKIVSLSWLFLVHVKHKKYKYKHYTLCNILLYYGHSMNKNDYCKPEIWMHTFETGNVTNIANSSEN